MEILFEDDYLIIVSKPAMMLSQPSFDKKRKPVQQALEDIRPDLKNNLYLHHRLDYETSGIFLMSKAKSVNKKLTEMFTNHSFQKTYLCLTRPNELKIGKKVTGDGDSNNWKIKNFMAPAKDMAAGKKRMISVRSGGWSAETEFKIVKTTSLFHVVEAKPKTGRTHQIRQHLQESYRSILGDNLYGGKSADVPRLMLHAIQLEFEHPVTNAQMNIQAPIPQDFLTCLEKQ